jgi:hypothetical protein
MNRIVAIAAALLVAGCAPPPGPGSRWVSLFDGNTIGDNWTRVGETNWRIEDKAIVADKRTSKTPAYLVSRHHYRDFEMRVEFWASHDANSGIFMRCANPAVITDKDCYEANIFDQRPDPSYGTGAIVHVATVAPMPKAGGKWNTFVITFQGPRLIVVMNGVTTVDVQDNKLLSGPVALQHGAGVIKFRKVEIRDL